MKETPEIRDCRDKEWVLEDRQIKRLNEAQLNLVCPSCFPLGEARPSYPKRLAETFDIRYPRIHTILDNELVIK